MKTCEELYADFARQWYEAGWDADDWEDFPMLDALVEVSYDIRDNR